MSNYSERSKVWSEEMGARYWWHSLPGMDFVPPVYSDLSQSEWEILRDWYRATDASGVIGECAVPLISFLHGIVMGNRAERIVQLGTCNGYTALLLGFMLRKINARHGLFSLEIDRGLCEIARAWLERAGLVDFVESVQGDSTSEHSVKLAGNYLGGAPQIVLLDTSHEYAATLRELDLWFAALESGGMIFVHDVSRFAESFDTTKSGGVRRAFEEWRRQNPTAETFLLNAEATSMNLPRPLYKDACGLGLIHKPR